jgi:hypothetical protein
MRRDGQLAAPLVSRGKHPALVQTLVQGLWMGKCGGAGIPGHLLGDDVRRLRFKIEVLSVKPANPIS